MILYDEFKSIAEIVEVHIHDKKSNYVESLALGHASGRFVEAYKKYVSQQSHNKDYAAALSVLGKYADDIGLSADLITFQLWIKKRLNSQK
jgi:hypothetical protein